MNHQRRAALTDIESALETHLEALQGILDDERGAFDNLPEALQESERGRAMQAAVDAMEEAANRLAEVVADIEAARQ